MQSGYYKLAQSRITLYLRMLGLSENDVAALTGETLGRLQGRVTESRSFVPLALEVTLEVLAERGIAPDPRYHPIFDGAACPPLARQSIAARPFDPKQKRSFPLRRTIELSFRRIVFFGLVGVSALLAFNAMKTILSPYGLTPLKWAILSVFTFLFGWLAINFWTVVIGFLASMLKGLRGLNKDCEESVSKNISSDISGLSDLSDFSSSSRIALVMPVHNEEVPWIFSSIRTMFESLQATGEGERFDLFVLSDSSRPQHAVSEEIHWAKLCGEVNGWGRIFYRRRQHRIHKKAGNIADFCRRWGRNYRYMIILDADSLMDGGLLVRMGKIMDGRPDLGILQTSPRPMNQASLISRLQQFSSHLYGPLLFAGLRFWQLEESGYWGHNAIIRLEPFMKCCALPRLSGKPPFGGEIMSHDFVEAALMRRAGYGVWLAHEFEGTFEELPPNLLEELRRDRRWCQGNIQHLRLIFMRGISFGHRVLFLNGNLFYFSSFFWFLMLVLMTVNAIADFLIKPVYFTGERTLFPLWTVQHRGLSIKLLIATAVFLFLPKILSLMAVLISEERRRKFGGALALTASVLVETVFSTVLAPIRMIFHSWYVILNLIGQKLVWGNQARLLKRTSVREALAAHLTGAMAAVIWGAVAFTVNRTLFWWLSVILGPLVLAVPITVLSSYPEIGLFFKRMRLLLTPVETDPPDVVRRFQGHYK